MPKDIFNGSGIKLSKVFFLWCVCLIYYWSSLRGFKQNLTYTNNNLSSQKNPKILKNKFAVPCMTIGWQMIRKTGADISSHLSLVEEWHSDSSPPTVGSGEGPWRSERCPVLGAWKMRRVGDMALEREKWWLGYTGSCQHHYSATWSYDSV